MSPDVDITPEVLCSLIEEKVRANFDPQSPPNMVQLLQIVEVISREYPKARTRTLFRERSEELGRLSTEVRSLGTVIAIELNGQELFIIYSHDINIAFYYRTGNPTDIAEIMRQFDESFFPAYSASRSARRSGHTVNLYLPFLLGLGATLTPAVAWAATTSAAQEATLQWWIRFLVTLGIIGVIGNFLNAYIMYKKWKRDRTIAKNPPAAYRIMGQVTLFFSGLGSAGLIILYPTYINCAIAFGILTLYLSPLLLYFYYKREIASSSKPNHKPNQPQRGSSPKSLLPFIIGLSAVLAPTVAWATGETTNKQAEPSLLYLGIMLGLMAAIIISAPVKLKRKITATYQAILLDHFANKFLNDKKDIRSLNCFIEAIQDFNGGTILYLDGVAFGRALGETMAWVDAALISLEKEVKDEGVRRHISGYLKALHSARFKKEKFFGVVSRYQDFSKFVDYWCRGVKPEVAITQREAEDFTNAMREFMQASPQLLRSDGMRLIRYEGIMRSSVRKTIALHFSLMIFGLGIIASLLYTHSILLFFVGALLFFLGVYPTIEYGTDSGATEEAKEKIEEVFGQNRGAASVSAGPSAKSILPFVVASLPALFGCWRTPQPPQPQQPQQQQPQPTQTREQKMREVEEAEVNRLIAELQDKQGLPSDRAQAARELGLKRSPRAIKALIDAFQDETPVQTMASAALAKMGEPAFQPLAEALRYGNVKARKSAIYALKEMKPPPVEAALFFIAALEDENPYVREVAADALGSRSAQSDELVPALIKALGDEVEEVRENAARSLGERGVEATEAIPLLESLAQDDPDELIREVAAEAVRKIKAVQQGSEQGMRLQIPRRSP